MHEEEEISEKSPESFTRRFWWLGVILAIALIFIGFLLLYRGKNDKASVSGPSTEKVAGDGNNQSSPFQNNENNPPLLIKSLPVVLGPYDAATNMAGDFKFTKQKLEFDVLYFDYGYHVPANSAGAAKDNPQPTFVVPLGTKVHAIVDGIVIDIPKLYSNDNSVLVAKNKNSQFIYETEHVKNVLVKIGDTVKAGDVIAEVSDYDTRNTPGYGLVEMGILKGGNPPSHVCPYLYLDPSVKDRILNSIEALHNDWNTYKSKGIYNSADYKAPGCLKTDEIEG